MVFVYYLLAWCSANAYAILSSVLSTGVLPAYAKLSMVVLYYLLV